MKWSLIIFCFNEEQTIQDVILDCNEFLIERHQGNGEIIFVNDGSTDRSLIIAESLLLKVPQLRIINHEKNMGIGATLNSGYNSALGEYICAIPGDGQFSIHELYQLTDFNDDFFVSFYRVKKNYNFYRTFLTNLNGIINALFNNIYLKDVNWVKVYKKSQLSAIKRVLNSSLVESEIVGKLLKNKITPIQYPSTYLPRKAGYPKGGSFKTLLLALKDAFSLINIVRNH